MGEAPNVTLEVAPSAILGLDQLTAMHVILEAMAERAKEILFEKGVFAEQVKDLQLSMTRHSESVEGNHDPESGKRVTLTEELRLQFLVRWAMKYIGDEVANHGEQRSPSQTFRAAHLFVDHFIYRDRFDRAERRIANGEVLGIQALAELILLAVRMGHMLDTLDTVYLSTDAMQSVRDAKAVFQRLESDRLDRVAGANETNKKRAKVIATDTHHAVELAVEALKGAPPRGAKAWSLSSLADDVRGGWKLDGEVPSSRSIRGYLKTAATKAGSPLAGLK